MGEERGMKERRRGEERRNGDRQTAIKRPSIESILRLRLLSFLFSFLVFLSLLNCAAAAASSSSTRLEERPSILHERQSDKKHDRKE